MSLLATTTPPKARVSITEYSPLEVGLEGLRSRFAGLLFDCTTAAGDRDARAARLEHVKLRALLEGKRKEVKAPALAYAKLIDSEATRIESAILLSEKPIDDQIKAQEERKEIERKAKAQAEAARIATLSARVSDLRKIAINDITKASSSQIFEQIAITESMVVDQSFCEFYEAAIEAQSSTLASLDSAHASALAREDAEREMKDKQALLDADRAQLAKDRAAQRAREEAAQAEASRLESERMIEANRLLAERRQEQARINEQQAKLDAEKNAIALQKAQIDDELKAERAKLDAEREAHDVKVAALSQPTLVAAVATLNSYTTKPTAAKPTNAVAHLSIADLVYEIERCGYKCEAGLLTTNLYWRALTSKILA